jgi:hypothetical protein
MLMDNGHQPLLEQVARRYDRLEVMAAVGALLALDPLDNHPTKIPPLPAFYQPALWARPLLRENGLALPDDALKTLGEMLRFPSEEGIYPGLQQVKDLCTVASLAAFAWDLFSAWQTAGAPSKESWAFTALGIFGNDDTARALTPLIRAWPGESQHKRATVGLDILAAIGTDIALMQLNGIAGKLKFKALQERAREKIGHIAASRALTVEELEDRLAPDLGLNDDGTLTLDFGPRRFIISFDEALRPYVRDENGSRLKDLPKPNKSDDKALATEAVNRYKALKKTPARLPPSKSRAWSPPCASVAAGRRKTSGSFWLIIPWSATSPAAWYGESTTPKTGCWPASAWRKTTATVTPMTICSPCRKARSKSVFRICWKCPRKTPPPSVSCSPIMSCWRRSASLTAAATP